MPDSADLAIFPFLDRTNLGWFLMTEVRGLHVVGCFAALECSFTFLALSPGAFDPVVVFTLRIVGDCAFLLLLRFLRTVIFDRVNGLKGRRKILVLCVSRRGLANG